MKKLTHAVVFVLVFIFIACDKETEENNSITEITEYVFTDNGYDNENTTYSPSQLNIADGLSIIKSKKEFRKIFSLYPQLKPIDFSTANFLIITEKVSYGVSSIKTSIDSLASGVYNINVNINLQYTTALERWSVAYIVPKYITDKDVELSVNYYAGGQKLDL